MSVYRINGPHLNFVMLLGFLTIQGSPITHAQEARKLKWEYCILEINSNRVHFADKEGKDMGTKTFALLAHLTVRGRAIQAHSFAELAKELKIPEETKAGIIEILNHLGDEGWELVSHTERKGERTGSSDKWTFKRPK